MVVATANIERILGEIEETPYEPMKEEQDEIISKKSTTNHQFHILNETLINFFGKGTGVQHFLPPIIIANYAT